MNYGEKGEMPNSLASDTYLIVFAISLFVSGFMAKAPMPSVFAASLTEPVKRMTGKSALKAMISLASSRRLMISN